jgi:DNA polymerase III delta prime subunit
MGDIRQQAKALYNALDMDKPIAFDQEGLVPHALPEKFYVEGIHGDGGGDPVQELADQVDWSEAAGAYLFSGNRGTGKTTELLRLAKQLKSQGCEVFYADMSDYLNLTVRLEISDFLVSVMGAFSEKIKARFNDKSPGDRGYLERVRDFLQKEVSLGDVSLPAGGAELQLALRDDPGFKELLQKNTRGHVAQLAKQAKDFALEAVQFIRQERCNPDLKVVLIVDSVERLRGVGNSEDINEVFKSAETVFSSHADKLRFAGLSVVYTVPPYLSALAGGLGAHYAGGRVYILPSMHVYQCCPALGQAPEPSEQGLSAMRAILGKRFAGWEAFLSQPQLDRLALSSGGDLRDFFRMIRQVCLKLPYLADGRADAPTLDQAEDAVRNDMLPIAEDDLKRLDGIARAHDPKMANLDELPIFARLLQGKYMLNYRNGEDWYDVHPLLRDKLTAASVDHSDA